MFFIFQPLNHLVRIREWARRHGAEFSLDAATFHLRIALRGRAVQMIPRFIMETRAGLAYTTHFADDAGFVGWLPYEVKRWPIATDKLAFKRFCEQAGLPVPAYWRTGSPRSDDFIVKGQQGSFGQNIRGPYRADTVDAQAVSPGPNEYCEQFIVGDSVKLWYWSGKPAAMERLPAPFVVGDGVRSLREIGATVRGSFDEIQTIDERAADMLAWQQLTPDSIPESGQRIQLEFKYATRFDPITVVNRNVISTVSSAHSAQLNQIGNSLLQGIPPEIREHTIFTVDAMIDREERIWLLEMNSHPMVHPDTYATMLDGLFAMGNVSATSHAR